jgi:hypothetical protein
MDNILCRKILELISEETGIPLKDLMKSATKKSTELQKVSTQTSSPPRKVSIETPTTTQVSPKKSLLDNLLSSFDFSLSGREEREQAPQLPSLQRSTSPPQTVFDIVSTQKSPQRLALSSSQTQIMTPPKVTSPKPIPKFWVVPRTPSSTRSSPDKARSPSPSRADLSLDTNLFPELPSLMYKESTLAEKEEETEEETEKEKGKRKSPVQKGTSPKTRISSLESISSSERSSSERTSERSMPSFFVKKKEKEEQKRQEQKRQEEKRQEEKPQPPPTWLRRKIKGPIVPKPLSPKEKGTSYDKETCKKFLQTDQVVEEGTNIKNPFTNKSITKGKATYKKILKECQQQVKSPNPSTQVKKSNAKKAFILPGESFEDLDVNALLEED